MENKPSIKLAVIGSRSFKNFPFVDSTLKKLQEQFVIELIISGGAIGADTIAEMWAQLNDIPCVIYEADWDNVNQSDAVVKVNKYGKQYDATAGHKRNKKIIDNADIIFAFWDSKSPGTKNSLTYAKEKRKPTLVYLYDENGIHGKFNLLEDNSYQPLNAK